MYWLLILDVMLTSLGWSSQGNYLACWTCIWQSAGHFMQIEMWWICSDWWNALNFLFWWFLHNCIWGRNRHVIPSVNQFPPLVRICPITVYNVAMFGGGHMLQLYEWAVVHMPQWNKVQWDITHWKLCCISPEYRHINKAPWATVWWQVTWFFHLHLTAEVEVQGLPDSSARLRYYDSLCLTVLSLF